ncbi:MAG: TIGR03936 family radical SAM-associated protein [Clostridia bacterium]|nr:TIGR03936 family radical SAM-associated protein [Clostridia bacterium]
MSEKGKLKPYSKDDYPMIEAPKFIRFKFRKVGNLQFISHLDLQKAMAKVLVRAKAPLWYSKGFNPHAKLIFALPLSVGAQSECEYLDVRVERAIPPLELMEHINNELTDELRFVDAYYPETALEDIYWAEYDFSIKTTGADEKLAREVEKLLTAEQVIILKKAKDKYKKIFFKEIDIAPYVRDVSVVFDGEIIKINAKLSASINQTHPHINPENIVTMLKDKLGILSGHVTQEQYDIIRTRIYFEDGKTDFR